MEQQDSKERFFTWTYANIMLADLFNRICMYMMLTLLPLYVIEGGFYTFAGLTTSAFMLVAVVFRPVSGKLVDTRGRHVVILFGAAVFVLATAFFSFQIPPWLLLTMRGLQGLGFSFFGTGVMTLATDIIPQSRMSEGIGYLGLTQTISRAFSPLLALSLKDAFGYPISFGVVFGIAALTLLSALILSWGKKGTRTGNRKTGGVSEAAAASSPLPSQSSKSEPLWEKLVDRDALKPATLMLFIMFASSGVQTFLVAHAMNKGIGNPGVFFTATAITIAVARLSVGRISQKFGSVAVLAPGIALISLSLIGMYSCANLATLLLSGALYGLGFGMLQPELNSLCVLSARKERRGSANSTFFMAMDLGQAAGAYAMGVLAGYAGLSPIFLVGAISAALTLAGYLLLQRRRAVRERGVREAH